MLFKELRHGDWFIFPEAVKDGDPDLMVKLEFPAHPRNFKGELEPYTALSIRSVTFFAVPDETEVIKVSLTFEELPTDARFILVDDLGKPTGVVIYRKVLTDPNGVPSSGNPFLALSEDGAVKTSVPEGRKVIKIR
ncbi:MAG: hypothetical protein PHZ04_04430 [Patescibacteria group bacterium]|nr:hypothetical protein [Patescibacteria group bacterium]MDD5294676.1 hypothetical protein [Patescibacteria group bacterium]MDD5554843.1 hypothetical protein [Patescibacteria group bacterium]